MDNFLKKFTNSIYDFSSLKLIAREWIIARFVKPRDSEKFDIVLPWWKHRIIISNMRLLLPVDEVKLKMDQLQISSLIGKMQKTKTVCFKILTKIKYMFCICFESHLTTSGFKSIFLQILHYQSNTFWLAIITSRHGWLGQ